MRLENWHIKNDLNELKFQLNLKTITELGLSCTNAAMVEVERDHRVLWPQTRVLPLIIHYLLFTLFYSTCCKGC